MPAAVRQIFPVEVKSGSGESLRSLHLMLQQSSALSRGLVLYSGSYKDLPEQKLRFLPLYSTPVLGDGRKNYGLPGPGVDQ